MSKIAFGKSEEEEIRKMINFYKSKNEDPKYSGLREENFVINLINLWVEATQMLLRQVLEQYTYK